jgi:hypothetical protein
VSYTFPLLKIVNGKLVYTEEPAPPKYGSDFDARLFRNEGRTGSLGRRAMIQRNRAKGPNRIG